MHEFALANDLFRIALDHAEKNHAVRIARLQIEMNCAADESQESLRFHLENLTHGTIAQGSQIDICTIPRRTKCMDCGAEFNSTKDQLACPQCHSETTRAMAQDEIRLVSIDVE